MKFYHNSIVLTILFCFIHFAPLKAGNLCKIVGSVVEKKTQNALPFVQVYVENLQIGTLTDDLGNFVIYNIPSEKIYISVSCLGYHQQKMELMLCGDTVLRCELEEESLRLSEVEVMADRREDGRTMSIRQSALDYIQSSSLSDVFQLLPGYLSSDGELKSVQLYSARQVGSDDNTSLGLSLVVDGVSVGNNAESQMVNVVDYQKEDEHSTVNRGVDMRKMSVNHVEQVEVIQGVASAKYGDMSSGVVKMSSKSGVHPLEAKVRINVQTKSGYVGRGFRLSDKSTLHAGVDVTKNQSDVTSDLTSYTRVSGQFNYMRKEQKGDGELIHNWKLNYIGTLDRDKKDALLKSSLDSYVADYHNVLLTVNERWRLGFSWLDELQLLASCSYTSDQLKRTLMVNAGGSFASTVRQEEGEQEGFYLPVQYVSDYKTDSKPLDINARISSFLLIGNHRVESGLEMRYSKNNGKGLTINEAYPSYPMLETQYRRRALSDIPAWVQSAFYIEDAMEKQWGRHSVNINMGFRVSSLLNLPKAYALHGKYHVEPRVNLRYAFPCFDVNGKEIKIYVRGGYGEHVKYPTLDMLYPNDATYHKISANYFTEDLESRFVWLSSRFINRENPSLQVNRNRKKEVGLDVKYGKMFLNITVFDEKSHEAFSSFSKYEKWAYNTYSAKLEMPEGKPSIEDFELHNDSAFIAYGINRNGASVRKKGIEYRWVLPGIKSLSTQIEVNGAYYKTVYKSSVQEQNRNAVELFGENYPYVGLYDWSNTERECSRFNTNIWINTHIARYGFIFTTMLQCIWLDIEQRIYNNGLPTSYMTMNGEIYPFTTDLQEDSYFKYLVLDHTKDFFNKESRPISLSLNLKATKELGKKMKMSFLVNRLWDYNKLKKNRIGYNYRNWTKPYFSMELTVQL